MKILVKLTAYLIILLIATTGMAASHNALSKISSWTCFYENRFPSENMAPYDLYIFDSSNHPELKPLKSSGSKVIGYISGGEVSKFNSYYSSTKMADLLVDENKNWPGAFMVDIGNKKWHKIVLNEIIPSVIKQGFEGIFIDTIDSAEYLEKKGIKGSVEGTIQLLKAIRRKFPKIIIVLNNGLFLTDKVGNEIDALVIEDIYTLYDMKNKSYRLATPEWTAERIKPAKAFQKKFKKPVLPLEYLKATDKKAIKKISKMAKSEGFIPYISDIHLNTIFYHQ